MRVDVVVRDRDDRPVTDLTAEDFEVFEDGVRQSVENFSSVGAVPPSDDAVGPLAESRSSEQQLPPAHATLALVFDRLSTEGQVSVRKAAREYVATGVRPGDVLSVFSIEESPLILQDFTSDRDLVQRAIEALGTRAAHAGATQAERTAALAQGAVSASAAQSQYLQYEAAGDDPGQQEARAAYGMMAAQLGMAQRIAEAFDRLERDQHGFAAAHGLTAIVDALRTVPGRKAIILFSEGLFKTEANQERFRSVVHAATQSGTSIYTVDAGGLDVRSRQSITRAQINASAALSRARATSKDGDAAGPYLTDLEAAVDSVRHEPRASLGWLADQTAGFFVRDTNDLLGALTRVDSDLRAYYLLGYTPTNETFDGRFREIDVKVRRGGVQVRSRGGYFAVRSAGPVVAHVAPALAILEGGRRPKEFPFFAEALPFPGPQGPVRVSMSAMVPGRALAQLVGNKRKRSLDLTFLAQVRDEEGVPLEAVSRRLVVDPSAVRAGSGVCQILMDVWLPPGDYALEIAAYEAESERASVSVSELEVPAAVATIEQVQAMLVKGGHTRRGHRTHPRSGSPPPLREHRPVATVGATAAVVRRKGPALSGDRARVVVRSAHRSRRSVECDGATGREAAGLAGAGERVVAAHRLSARRSARRRSL